MVEPHKGATTDVINSHMQAEGFALFRAGGQATSVALWDKISVSSFNPFPLFFHNCSIGQSFK